MAKAIITNAEQVNGFIMVTYATGTTRQYAADKIPGTVAEWIRSNATAKPETAAEPQEPQKVPEIVLEPEPEEIPVEEAKVPVKAEEPQKVTRMEKQPVPGIRQRSTIKTEPQKEAELPAEREARTQPATVRKSQTAAEAVMMGLCLTLMYVFEAMLGLLSLLAIYVSGRIQRLWSHRAEIWNAILTGTTLTVKAILTAVVWTGAEIIKAVVIQMYLFNIRYSEI